jgi:hypothetical protein
MTQQFLVGHGLLVIDASRLCSRHNTILRTPPDEWSDLRRELYLTKHNNHKRHNYMFPEWFEPTIPANEWSQTHTLDRTATGIGLLEYTSHYTSHFWILCRKPAYVLIPYLLHVFDSNYFSSFMTQQPLVNQGSLIIWLKLSHSDTPHSAGRLWLCDRPVAGTSTWQN